MFLSFEVCVLSVRPCRPMSLTIVGLVPLPIEQGLNLPLSVCGFLSLGS